MISRKQRTQWGGEYDSDVENVVDNQILGRLVRGRVEEKEE